MRLFSCPARYRRHVEASLALALAEVRRDIARRDDEDPRVQKLATVLDSLIDLGESGDCFIAVVIPNEQGSAVDNLTTLLGELPETTRLRLEA